VATAAAAYFLWPAPEDTRWTDAPDGADVALSPQFDSAPRLALRPRRIADIAKALGYRNPEDAVAEALVFAERVTNGFLPTGFAVDCPQKRQASLCGALEDYFAPKLDARASGERRSSPRGFAIHRMRQLQQGDFGEMRSSAPSWSFNQIRKFSVEALKTKTCPRSFSLVLARALEEHLPDARVWPLLDSLDAHGLSCLDGDDANAEFVLQRVALLKLARGEPQETVALLEKAQGVAKKREEYRTLFWLGRAYEALGRAPEASSTADLLAAQFPLSWYTIASEARRGRDPLAFFVANPNYPDLYESGDPAFDRRVNWLHMLMSLPDAGFAVRRYGEFVVKSAGPTTNPAVLQYLARLFSHTGFHRLQIIVINQMGSARPNFLSVESLRLLYPKPFFDELESHSSVDTALLLGLARQESGFDPNARSRANAQGLLQVLPSTAYGIKKSRKKELYDYAHNIEVGAKYLLSLIERFDGSAEKAFAAYNAGPTNVRRWEKRFGFVADPQLFNDLIPFRETRDYVPSILRNAYWYHRLFPSLGRSVAEDQAATSALLKSYLPR